VTEYTQALFVLAILALALVAMTRRPSSGQCNCTTTVQHRHTRHSSQVSTTQVDLEWYAAVQRLVDDQALLRSDLDRSVREQRRYNWRMTALLRIAGTHLRRLRPIDLRRTINRPVTYVQGRGDTRTNWLSVMFFAFLGLIGAGTFLYYLKPGIFVVADNHWIVSEMARQAPYVWLILLVGIITGGAIGNSIFRHPTRDL